MTADEIVDCSKSGGDCGLAVFRQWPAPRRTDLRIYAYSLEKGSNFDAYDGFELGNWEAGPPAFPEISIDAVFRSHFIEHIADPGAFLEWAGSRLSRNNRPSCVGVSESA